MRKSPIISIVIWSVVAVLVVAVFVVSNIFGGVKSMNTAELVEVKSQVIEESINKIKVDWICGGVNIYRSEDEAIRYVQKAISTLPEHRKVKAYVKDGNLELSGGRRKLFNITKPPFTILDIYLPEKDYDKITINTVDARIKCDAVTAKGIFVDGVSGDIILGGKFDVAKLNTVSGKINCENFEANSFEADSVSGDFNVDGSVNNLKSNTVSGNLTVSSTVAMDTLKCDSVSGNITVKIPENSGFMLGFDKVSGDILSDFAIKKVNNKFVYKDESRKYKVNVVSGDLNLYVRDI